MKFYVFESTYNEYWFYFWCDTDCYVYAPKITPNILEVTGIDESDVYHRIEINVFKYIKRLKILEKIK